MLPAFRSNLSVASFCTLLSTLLVLPVVTSWIGHPSREQAYAGMFGEVGPIGVHVREIFDDPSDADVVLLGTSLTRAGVDKPTLERGISSHTGRPAHVVFLALNWQGLDLQYFLLRDYLKTHRAKLIAWCLPVPGSRSLTPHVEAFRFIRFGEDSDALTGLPPIYRLALYGDMILGAPRELLSHVRQNRLGKEETEAEIHAASQGYYGKPFLPEKTESLPAPPLEETYEPAPYPRAKAVGPPLNSYELHFAKKIVALAKQSGTKIVLLHIPTDAEQGLSYMPERSVWSTSLSTDAPMVGVSSAELFRDIDPSHFYNFYYDQHLNMNGSVLFTNAILPAVLKAYEQ